MIEAIPCKICTALAHHFGSVDFNKNCAGVEFPPTGEEVHYYRCTYCDFVFTPAFDTWSHSTLSARIYNVDYARVDPEYVTGTRAFRNATQIKQLFPMGFSILDFGGGDGKLADILRANDFPYAQSFDPINGQDFNVPESTFNLVTCFEVLEHSRYPERLVKVIARVLEPGGIVFFSTHTLPTDFDSIGLDWWYIGPRNGHVSIFSMKALHILWDSVGFNVVSLNANRHFAQRKVV